MSTVGDELRHLRRGRGVLDTDLPGRIGPSLKSLSGIEDSDSPAEVRSKLIALVDELARDLTEDLRLALSAALAIHPDTQHRFLDERMGWLSFRLARSVRSARRRVEEAIQSIDSSYSVTPVSSRAEHAPPGWHLGSLRTLLRLDGPAAVSEETRTIVADVNGLEEILISTRVPVADADASQLGVDFEVVYGGSLRRAERPTKSYFRYAVGLPHPLAAGDRHEVRVLLRVAHHRLLRPRYVFEPLRRCDSFELLIRFGPDTCPAQLWRIPGIPCGMTDDFEAPEFLESPDAFGEVRLNFGFLKPGFAYGAKWAARGDLLIRIHIFPHLQEVPGNKRATRHVVIGSCGRAVSSVGSTARDSRLRPTFCHLPYYLL